MPLESITTNVLDDVHRERIKQDERWGLQDHDLPIWMAILGEEYGELCQESLRHHFGGVRDANLRDEAIQVAAVAVAIVECIDRNGLLDGER